MTKGTEEACRCERTALNTKDIEKTTKLAAMGGSFTRMEEFTKDYEHTGSRMEKALMCLRTEPYTQEIGKTTCKKEWELKSLSEGRDTKGSSAEDSSMESGNFSL